VSNILDTPSFDAKVKKKPRFSPILSSTNAIICPISFANGHDTDALLSASLNSDNKNNIDSCSWDSDKAMACFNFSDFSFGSCCKFTNMPKVATGRKEKRGRKTECRAKSRATLWSEASARDLTAGRTFACPTCSHTITRARNLRYHMCEMHNLWCATLKQTASFPQPDSIYRMPTAPEFDKYGHAATASRFRPLKKKADTRLTTSFIATSQKTARSLTILTPGPMIRRCPRTIL